MTKYHKTSLGDRIVVNLILVISDTCAFCSPVHDDLMTLVDDFDIEVLVVNISHSWDAAEALGIKALPAIITHRGTHTGWLKREEIFEIVSLSLADAVKIPESLTEIVRAQPAAAFYP